MANNRIKISIETQARLKAVEESQKKLEKLSKEVEESKDATLGLSAAGGALGGAFRLGGAIAGFNILISKVAQLAVEVPRFTRQVIEEYDRLDSMINAVADSQEEANAIYDKARETAYDFGVDLDSTAKSYVRLKVAGEAAKFNGEEIDAVFESLIKTGVALSLSNEEVRGTLRAVEQMMSKGTVQAEELRGQLGERLPGAFNLAAQAMGVTTQELNKMLDNGEVLAIDLLPKLAEVLDERFADAAGENADKLVRNTNRLTTEVKELVNVLARPISEKLSGSIRDLADGLREINENLREGPNDLGERRFNAIQALAGRDLDSGRNRRSRETIVARRQRLGNAVIQELGLTEDDIAEAQDALDRVEAIKDELDKILISEGAETADVQQTVGRGRGARQITVTGLGGPEEEKAKLRFDLALKQLRAEREIAAEKTKQATAEEFAEFLRKTSEGIAELERKHSLKNAETSERLVLLEEERVRLAEELGEHLSKQDVLGALDTKEEQLKVESEIAKLNEKQANEAERKNREEIQAANELARLQGLRSVGNGRFVEDNLSRTDRARASVEGQKELAFVKGDEELGTVDRFEQTGDTLGGLNDERTNFQSISEGAIAAVFEYQAAVGTLGDQINRTFTSIFQSVEEGLAGSIQGLIDGTMTWQDALNNISSTVVNAIIASFARMAAQWITQQVLMMTVGKSLQAANLAANVPIAAAQTAIWTPPAIAASIATLGAAAVTGTTLAKSMILAGALPLANGGLVSGPGGPKSDIIPAMLSNGEFVVNAAATARNRDLLETINRGTSSVQPAAAASVAQSANTAPSDLSADRGDVTVAGVFSSDAAMEKFLRGSRGRRAVLDAGRKVKHRLFNN